MVGTKLLLIRVCSDIARFEQTDYFLEGFNTRLGHLVEKANRIIVEGDLFDRLLGNDRPCIYSFIDIVNRDASLPFSVDSYPVNRRPPPIPWQQSPVKVYNAQRRYGNNRRLEYLPVRDHRDKVRL